MLYWALIFFILALIAGLFGFVGISSAPAAASAQILFWIFFAVSVVSLGAHLVAGRDGRSG